MKIWAIYVPGLDAALISCRVGPERVLEGALFLMMFFFCEYLFLLPACGNIEFSL